MEMQTRGLINYFYKDGALQSVDPCTAHLGFSYWLNLVPPFRPERMLVLGYGAGTVANLTRKIHGDVIIAGVDLEPFDTNGKDQLYKEDAFEFVRSAGLFDYVVVDLFNGGKVDGRIYDRAFVRHLSRVVKKLLAVNTWGFKDRAVYADHFDEVATKKWYANEIVFFKAKDCQDQFLPPPMV